MKGNTFGQLFSVRTFGASHGVAIGGVIEGCPAGFALDLSKIQAALDRRKPGQSTFVTQRKESDKVRFLSGIFEGLTDGTPLAFVIENEDQRSKDYSHIADVYRPSHADYTYDAKYGHRDYRGGGRSSARETACRVVAGAVAQQFLDDLGVEVLAYVESIGEFSFKADSNTLSRKQVESSPIRVPDADASEQMERLIYTLKKQGDTIGGTVECFVKGVPAGWGEPVFDRLNACLAHAMMSINAAKGFEMGLGFSCTTYRGSEFNDAFFINDEGNIDTRTNHSAGIQGGISNGQEIRFRVAFKPVATLIQKQQTVNRGGQEVEMQGKGRHDPCVLPRAVPIVEAMAAMVLFDAYLMNQTTRWKKRF